MEEERFLKAWSAIFLKGMNGEAWEKIIGDVMSHNSPHSYIGVSQFSSVKEACVNIWVIHPDNKEQSSIILEGMPVAWI